MGDKDYEKMVRNEIEKFEQKRKATKEIEITKWIKDNKPLMVVGGAITSGGAAAVAWIVENIEEIQNFIDLLSAGYRTSSDTPVVNLGSLEIFGVSLDKALGFDPILIDCLISYLEKNYKNIKFASKHTNN